MYAKTTWVPNALPSLTGAQLNRIEQGIADAFPHSRVAHAAMFSSVDRSIPNSAWTGFAFNTVLEDDTPSGLTSMVDLANGRLYCRRDGLYVAAYSFYFGSSGAGRRIAEIDKQPLAGGFTTFARWEFGATPDANANIGTTLMTRPFRMVAGEYVFARNFQSSGGALNIATDATGGASPVFSLTQVGG